MSGEEVNHPTGKEWCQKQAKCLTKDNKDNSMNPDISHRI